MSIELALWITDTLSKINSTSGEFAFLSALFTLVTLVLYYAGEAEAVVGEDDSRSNYKIQEAIRFRDGSRRALRVSLTCLVVFVSIYTIVPKSATLKQILSVAILKQDRVIRVGDKALKVFEQALDKLQSEIEAKD